jgi:ElaB/YqjD/DUF883 family membrane-anchored ribosome-binding protein
MAGRTRFKEQTGGLHGFLPSHGLEKVMASNLATDYEAKLDDITRRGVSALRGTEQKANAAISGAADASRDALESAEKVRDSVNGAILHSLKVRPYTTLAIAGLIGFAYGALRR